MVSISELLAQVKANGHEVWIAGPQSESAIVTLESKLGITFPPSYRDFLTLYGAMAIYDSTVSGIINGDPLSENGGSIYGDTLLFQREWGLPNHLLVIQPNDDAPYCFDIRVASATGEFPVVCYELRSKNAGKIAIDFNDWIRQFFLEGWVTGN